MTPSLADQTIAVFGASSGIGLAVARGAHALGARVIAVGRDRARLAAAVGALPLQLAQADIADEAQVAALLRDVGALDHVVVTAGSVVGPSSIATLDFDLARDAIATKLQGSLLVAKHAAPRLRPGGSIGFTAPSASVYRSRPAPVPNQRLPSRSSNEALAVPSRSMSPSPRP